MKGNMRHLNNIQKQNEISVILLLKEENVPYSV